MSIELSKKERAAVDALQRLARTWPKSLWLFSASGSLCVMKGDVDGGRIHNREGGMDSDYVVTTIEGISNDGGDW